MPLDIFRVLAGTLLALHFAGLAPRLPELRGFTVAGVAAALGIAFGVSPRLGAGTAFVTSVWLYRRAFPIVSLDDYLASVVAFWLCLLPVGKTWSLTRLRASAGWSTLRVEGWTASVFTIHLVCVQLDVGLWRALAPRWPDSSLFAIALCATAAGLVLPSALARIACIIGLLFVHGVLLRSSGLVLSHGLFVCATPLLLGEVPTQAARSPFPARAVVGATVVLLFGIHAVASRAGLSSVSAATERVLSDAGLFPASPAKTNE